VNSTLIRLKINRRKLSSLKFIMESYEGLALTTTLDATSGLVLISIAPGAESEAADLLLAIKSDLGIVDGWGSIEVLLDNKQKSFYTDQQQGV